MLILGSRGIGHRDRHLMDDLRDLMPHCRRESKVRTQYITVSVTVTTDEKET